MRYYKTQLEETIIELKVLLDEYEAEYAECPEGKLHYCLSHGRKRYSIANKVNGKLMRKSADGNDNLLRGFARKAFLKSVISELKRDIEAITTAAETVSDFDTVGIIKRLPCTYADLPESYFFNKGKSASSHLLPGEDRIRCELHKEWADEEYERSTYKQEHLRFLTSTGIRVRSKSELIIVEELARFGVPLRYEQIVRLGDKNISPDFTFQDANGELFFWEHAGMMEDSDYSRRHSNKLKLYESFGIVPWRNLILTYDRNGTVNVPMIRSIIRYDVIPRM